MSQILLATTHLWYENIFFYLFIISTAISIISWLYFIKVFKRKSGEMKLMQQQYAAKVDVIRKEHTETLEKIRIEMLKREGERTRQWIESEKETLHVLNGVSIIMDLYEKIGKSDSEKLFEKLEEIQKIIESIIGKEK